MVLRESGKAERPEARDETAKEKKLNSKDGAVEAIQGYGITV